MKVRLGVGILLLSIVLSACGDAGQAGATLDRQIPPAEATKAARRGASEPYPTPADTPIAPARAAATAIAVTVTPTGSTACSELTGGGEGASRVKAIRVGSQPGFDRFVIEFESAVPRYWIRAQPSAAFSLDGAALPLTLRGAAGLVIGVRQTADPTSAAAMLGSGKVLLEVRELDTASGVTRWALGLSQPACGRASVLDSPPRLVVDVPVSDTRP